jgi:hypothetical protein
MNSEPMSAEERHNKAKFYLLHPKRPGKQEFVAQLRTLIKDQPDAEKKLSGAELYLLHPQWTAGDLYNFRMATRSATERAEYNGDLVALNELATEAIRAMSKGRRGRTPAPRNGLGD